MKQKPKSKAKQFENHLTLFLYKANKHTKNAVKLVNLMSVSNICYRCESILS